MSELENLLNRLVEENPSTILIDRQEVIDVSFKKDNDGEVIISIYTGSKYAQFHDELVQTAPTIPELEPLIQYLGREGYTTNID